MMFVRFGTLLFAMAGSVHISISDEYTAFRKEHRSSVDEDSVPYQQRFELFKSTKERVEAHNAIPGITWKQAINVYADWTEAEKKSQLGYKRLKLPKRSKAESLAALDTARKDIAISTDWTQVAAVTGNRVKNQGYCGSCWAVSSIGALEMYNEMKRNNTQSLSWYELVDCVPNPGICGGAGGCQGATAELAFDYVASKGLSTSSTYLGAGDSESVGAVASSSCQPGSKGYDSGGGYKKLTENNATELLITLSTVGPVVVSVDASTWNSYKSGIMGADKDGCGPYVEKGKNYAKRVTVNHAVLAVGYGHDSTLDMDYWLIRNSWGSHWGENGFIRIHRTGSDDSWCDTDYDPLVGVGCVGNATYNIAPSEKTLRVCGMCGVLSDSSYPIVGPSPPSTFTQEQADVDPSGKVLLRSERKN